MHDSVTSYEDHQLDDLAASKNKLNAHDGYEEQRRRAELILERRRLRQLLNEDDLDFDW